jgi:hypothetical protein
VREHDRRERDEGDDGERRHEKLPDREASVHTGASSETMPWSDAGRRSRECRSGRTHAPARLNASKSTRNWGVPQAVALPHEKCRPNGFVAPRKDVVATSGRLGGRRRRRLSVGTPHRVGAGHRGIGIGTSVARTEEEPAGESGPGTGLACKRGGDAAILQRG